MNESLFKIVSPTTLESAPASIHTGAVNISSPSLAVYHKFGYWPKEAVEPTKPSEEEGYIVYDDGYQYIDDLNGGKIIKRIYRKLLIVDPGAPELSENQELISDEWIETDTERRHVYNVYEIIDNPPEIEDTQTIIDSHWELDDVAKTKTKVYEVRNVVDNPPSLKPGQQVVEDHWDDDGVTRTHVYDKIMTVVDNPPELQDGQEIVDRTFTDDDVTEIRTYHYEVRFIIDNPPELEEGQQIVEDHWDDDGTTRTHVYDVRTIVDNPPTLKECEFIYEDHWDDDGTVRTHVYDVWTKVDVVPEIDPISQRLITTDKWEEDPVAKQVKRVYIIKSVVDEVPACDPDGNFWWEKDGEEETDTSVIIKYKKVYREWRIFSKIQLEMVIFKLGRMTAFDAFLNSVEMTNEAGETAKLRRFYDQANEIAENHKLFTPYYQAALRALSLTEEEGEQALKNCVKSTFIIKD